MAGPVVVGLDGSPASVTALRWAAREAVDQQLPVLLLHSWTIQPLDVPIPRSAHDTRRRGREILRRTSTELLRLHPGLVLTTELVPVPAAQALLDRAGHASLLVLGSRGHGSVAGFLLGSVALDVLGLAPCPAVAVRADDPAVGAGWGRPEAADRDEIVVGVRQSGPVADPLLEFAFTTAAEHGRGVRAVSATAGADVEDETRDRPAKAVAPWREKFPEVPVVEQTVTGPASQALPALSAHACLTVVGRRSRLPHPAWKLGPVAHAALHHVPGPVAVVPHG